MGDLAEIFDAIVLGITNVVLRPLLYLLGIAALIKWLSS